MQESDERRSWRRRLTVQLLPGVDHDLTLLRHWSLLSHYANDVEELGEGNVT
jgi:hypothetical protein